MFTKKELYCANCGRKIDLKFGLPDSCTNCKIRFEFPKIDLTLFSDSLHDYAPCKYSVTAL